VGACDDLVTPRTFGALLAFKISALRAYLSQLSGLHRDEPCERLAPPRRFTEAFVAASS
jgi:hypothetical protein